MDPSWERGCHGPQTGAGSVHVTELSWHGLQNPRPLIKDDGVAKVLLEEFLSPSKLQALAQVEDLRQVTVLEMCVDTRENSLGNFGAHLPNLSQLKLNNSLLASIRDLGSSLSHLQILWMVRCGLADLDGISSLRSLKELYMSYNNISDLSQICLLEHLEVLDLEGNNIENIEQVQYLSLCKKLNMLTLEGNLICLRPNPEAAQAPDYNYRAEVKKLIPHLQFLDDVPAAQTSPQAAREISEDWLIVKESIKESSADCSWFSSFSPRPAPGLSRQRLSPSLRLSPNLFSPSPRPWPLPLDRLPWTIPLSSPGSPLPEGLFPEELSPDSSDSSDLTHGPQRAHNAPAPSPGLRLHPGTRRPLGRGGRRFGLAPRSLGRVQVLEGRTAATIKHAACGEKLPGVSPRGRGEHLGPGGPGGRGEGLGPPKPCSRSFSGPGRQWMGGGARLPPPPFFPQAAVASPAAQPQQLPEVRVPGQAAVPKPRHQPAAQPGGRGPPGGEAEPLQASHGPEKPGAPGPAGASRDQAGRRSGSLGTQVKTPSQWLPLEPRGGLVSPLPHLSLPLSLLAGRGGEPSALGSLCPPSSPAPLEGVRAGVAGGAGHRAGQLSAAPSLPPQAQPEGPPARPGGPPFPTPAAATAPPGAGLLPPQTSERAQGSELQAAPRRPLPQGPGEDAPAGPAAGRHPQHPPPAAQPGARRHPSPDTPSTSRQERQVLTLWLPWAALGPWPRTGHLG
uniref:Leucine rich repeat containing 56 n=1 Tax=Sarcophilus harrisii TaxID=9305 RepID=A0A7N4P0P6_SARHA